MLFALDLLQFVEAVHVHRKRRQNQLLWRSEMAGRGGDHCHEYVDALAVSIEQQKRFMPGGWHERRDVVRVDRLDAPVALGDFSVVVPAKNSPIFLIHLRLDRDSRIFYAKYFRLRLAAKRRGFEVKFGCCKFEVHENLLLWLMQILEAERPNAVKLGQNRVKSSQMARGRRFRRPRKKAHSVPVTLSNPLV